MAFEQLRPYQIEDAKFLAQLDACACFNQQRTGKTPTALYVCELKKLERVLIICPASAVYPWVEAVNEWAQKPAIAYVGSREERKERLTNWSYALVASFDTLKQQAEGKKEIYQLLKCKPDGVIVDEAHRIGHPNIERSKAVFAIRTQIPFRMALTGSPAVGLSKDIWGILHLLYPNTFKSYWDFIYKFYYVSEKYGAGGQRFKDIGHIRPEMAPVLQQILAQISTQRKRKDVMAWLPEKDRQIIRLDLTKEQHKYLGELAMIWETEHVITKGTLDRLIRYRQICLDPALLDLPGESPKTKWIQQYREDYPETPTLIFSKFTQYLQLLSEKLKAPIICGATPLMKRNTLVQDFQNGKLNLLLLNIEACKESLTLDRAEVAIFTDKYPPIGDIDQAEDRFVATTQGRAAKPHTIYELAMRASYDEDILAMLTQRRDETSIVNDYKTKYERKRTKA